MMKEEAGIKVLKEVKEVFDEYDVEYWLDQGTLLGAVRDEKFIPWDHDIDLCTWQSSTTNIASACQKLRDRGFNVFFSPHNKGGAVIKKERYPSVSITPYRLTGDTATIDWITRKQTAIGCITEHLLWVLSALPYTEVNPEELGLRAPFITMNLLKITKALSSSWRKRFANTAKIVYEKIGSLHAQLVVPSHYFTNLSTIKFYGMEFKVPAKTEEYLSFKYGKDWKVPRRDWMPDKDDGAVVHLNR